LLIFKSRPIRETGSAFSVLVGSKTLFSLIPGQRRKLGKKEIPSGQLLKEKQAKPHAQLLKICSKVKLMKIFFAKSDRLKAPSPFGFIQILKVKSDLNSCLKFSFRLFPLA